VREITTNKWIGYNAVANANPYRYRGYRYDLDISMYYLNSRYYNPQIGRFINADGMLGQFGDIQSTNMYAYCANNPVMYLDPSGEAWWHWAAAIGVAATLTTLTIISCGGFAAAYGAIILAGNGIALAGLSSTATVLAFATAGSALGLAGSAIYAGFSSSSADEFADYGLVGLISTATGGALGAYTGYTIAQYNKYYFPNDPDDFNPNNLGRYDYDNGNVIKWQEPGGGKAVFEYNTHDIPHYHITPDGVNRMINPFTNDTHMYPGNPIPFDFWHYFK